MRPIPAADPEEPGRQLALPTLVISLSALFAASTLLAQEAADLRAYLPADVGDLWSFATEPGGDRIAYAIGSQERLDSGRTVLRREESNGDQRLQWVDTEGLWIASFHSADGTDVVLVEPVLLIPSSLDVGAVHRSEVTTRTRALGGPTAQGTLSVRVERLPNEKVATPAGTFPDCLVLRFETVSRSEQGAEETTLRTEWRVVGVGPVRFEERGGAGTISARLTGASIGDRLVEGLSAPPEPQLR